MSARRKTSSSADELDAELGRDRLVGEGIVGDELHVEGLGQAEQSRRRYCRCRASRSVRPTRPTPMWSERLAKPAAASRVSRSLTISLPVSASMKRDDRDGDRPAHAVGRDDQRDARLACRPRHRRCRSRRRSARRRRAGRSSARSPRAKRWASRISASKSSSCSARIGLADSRNAISTPGAAASGARSKSG